MAKKMRCMAAWMALLMLILAPGTARMAHPPHVYPADWTVQTAPGCTTPGLKTKACTVAGCTNVQSEQIPPAGHQFGAWEVYAQPGCDSTGLKTRSCTKCGTQEQASIPATGHAFGGWTVYSAATCTAQQMETRSCSKCGTTESRYTTPALGHDYTGWTVQTLPGCLYQGSEIRSCNRCGMEEHRSTAALGHDFGPWYEFQAPNCTQMGLERKDCSRCGTVESRYLNATGHAMGAWTVISTQDCTHPGEKSRVCGTCGYVEPDYKPPLGHQMGPWTEVTPPGCTTQGKTQRTCARCGVAETGVLYALNHAMGPFVQTLAPTCAMEGERVSTCGRGCGHEIKEKIKKLPHTFAPWQVDTPSTCQVAGLQSRTCMVCGHKETAALKLGKHQYDGGWLALRKPTLEKVGIKIKRCTVCNREIQRREYAPDSYRYQVAGAGFGVPAASVLPQLQGSGFDVRLIPIALSGHQEQAFPIMTADGYQVGLLRAVYDGQNLTLSYRMHDPATVVISESLMVFPGLDAVTPEALSPAAPAWWFGGGIPMTGDEKPVVAARFLLSYDQKGPGNSPFTDSGMYTDGVTSCGAVLQEMMNRLTAR